MVTRVNGDVADNAAKQAESALSNKSPEASHKMLSETFGAMNKASLATQKEFLADIKQDDPKALDKMNTLLPELKITDGSHPIQLASEKTSGSQPADLSKIDPEVFKSKEDQNSDKIAKSIEHGVASAFDFVLHGPKSLQNNDEKILPGSEIPQGGQGSKPAAQPIDFSTMGEGGKPVDLSKINPETLKSKEDLNSEKIAKAFGDAFSFILKGPQSMQHNDGPVLAGSAVS
jgi:hypothetical protein